MSAESAEVIQTLNLVEWVASTLVQGQHAKDDDAKSIQKIKFGRRGIGHGKKRV